MIEKRAYARESAVADQSPELELVYKRKDWVGTLNLTGLWKHWRNRGMTWESLTEVKEKSPKQQGSMVVNGVLGKVLGVFAARWERLGRQGYNTTIKINGPQRWPCEDFAVGRLTIGYARWTKRLSVIKLQPTIGITQLFLSAHIFIFVVHIYDTFQPPAKSSPGIEEFETFPYYCNGIMKQDVNSFAKCWTLNVFVL